MAYHPAFNRHQSPERIWSRPLSLPLGRTSVTPQTELAVNQNRQQQPKTRQKYKKKSRKTKIDKNILKRFKHKNQGDSRNVRKSQKKSTREKSAFREIKQKVNDGCVKLTYQIQFAAKIEKKSCRCQVGTQIMQKNLYNPSIVRVVVVVGSLGR